MRALVLSGGGSRGAFQVGVLQALLDMEENSKEWYKVFCGISVGAINSSYLAQFTNKRSAVTGLYELWLRVSEDGIKKNHIPLGKVHALWTPSFYDTTPLRYIIRHNLKPKMIRTSGNRLRVGAVGLKTGEFKIFDENYEDLHAAVEASSVFPTMFTPVEMEGQLWVDGGVRNTTPLKTAIDIAGVDEIDVIMADPLNRRFRRKEPKNVLDLGMQVFETMIDEILNEDIKKAQYYNDAVKNNKEVGEGRKYVKLRIFQPYDVLPVDPLDFGTTGVKAMVSMGYQAAKTQL